MSTPPTVLFICQHNAGRSQLAAHLFNHIAEGRAVATSAGISPAEHINPTVAQSLNELGITTKDARPRPVTVEELSAVDVVVTMKPGLRLPSEVAGELLEWKFPDPTNWEIDGVRELRDQIGKSVEDLLDTISSR